MSGWQDSDRRAELPPDWNRISRQVLAEQPTCYVCKRRPSVQCDHKQRGNDHSRQNLAGICLPCHAWKSAKEGNDARAPQQKEARAGLKHPGVS